MEISSLPVLLFGDSYRQVCSRFHRNPLYDLCNIASNVYLDFLQFKNV